MAAIQGAGRMQGWRSAKSIPGAASGERQKFQGYGAAVVARGRARPEIPPLIIIAHPQVAESLPCTVTLRSASRHNQGKSFDSAQDKPFDAAQDRLI